MRWLSTIHPVLPRSCVLAATVVLGGCPSNSGEVEDDETSDEGPVEPLACAEPGSELLDDTKPAPLPSNNSQPFSCSTGWATDAPQLDATWTVELASIDSESGFNGITMAAHPDGGVVVALPGLFARYAADGSLDWSVANVIAPQSQVVLAVEEAGTIVLSVYDWNNEDRSLDRYAADGSSIGPVVIPWNSDFGEVWALVPNRDELLVGAVDLDAEGSWETTLLRLDAGGNLLLRKSTNMTNSGQLAVNDSDSAVFGNAPSFVLALANGAVLGNLTPSAGGVTRVIGFGSDFVTTGSAVGDFSVGRYSEFGVEQWLQTYDRATLGDNGRAIAANPDMIVAAGSTQLLDFTDIYWFSTQPWVVGVDPDGNATWSDRISAIGDATAVAIGPNGEVYVAGAAEGLDDDGDVPPLISWLRRYDP